MNSTAVVERPIGGSATVRQREKHAARSNAPLPDYCVDVSRPALPSRWTTVVLAPVELLALAWSVPFGVLLFGIPIALLVALIDSVGRFFLR